MKIYTVSTMDNLNPGEVYPRTVGYFADSETAIDAVETNRGDLSEGGYYPYVLIEEIKDGLYHPALKESRWLFEWNLDEKRYVPIEEPEIWERIVGFSMG